jgi:hypothetical protein
MDNSALSSSSLIFSFICAFICSHISVLMIAAKRIIETAMTGTTEIMMRDIMPLNFISSPHLEQY